MLQRRSPLLQDEKTPVLRLPGALDSENACVTKDRFPGRRSMHFANVRIISVGICTLRKSYLFPHTDVHAFLEMHQSLAPRVELHLQL